MEESIENVECCCYAQPQPTLTISQTNDHTYNIVCTKSCVKGSGSKLSTKVSNISDTAEVTVSTAQNHHLPYESSFSSSLTSRPIDTNANAIINDAEEKFDSPLPDEIPRFIYARNRYNTVTSSETTVSVATSTTTREPLLNDSKNTVLPPSQHVAKSTLQRWFHRRWPMSSRRPVNHHHRHNSNSNHNHCDKINNPQRRLINDEYDEIMTRMQLMNDDSANSDLVCGGMTLVSL